MIHRLVAVLAAACTATLAQAAPAECTVRSGASTAALVELYTSEGCDSCPPADRWLSALPQAGFGPARIVPLALHVDYWDYIGWKDPFAKPLFAARQREIASVTRSRVVYTPQVVLAGKDYRGWPARSRFAEAVAAVNAMPARAEIALELRGDAAGAMEVRATASVPRREDQEDTALFVAVYENSLVSRVTAGENRGATLAHDYVVREWWGPLALDRSGAVSFTRAIAAQRAGSGGVAAFVQSRRTGEVLQALALPACNG
jgi:hypothetical protein